MKKIVLKIASGFGFYKHDKLTPCPSLFKNRGDEFRADGRMNNR